MKRIYSLSLGCLALTIPSIVAAPVDDKPIDLSRLPPPAKATVDFVRDVQPLLVARCIKCHGPNKQASGLALHRKAKALAGGDNGPVIQPGKSDQSKLIHYVTGLVPDHVMPPPAQNYRLTAEEIGLLRAWIDQGALWPLDADKAGGADHWAYKKPIKTPIPAVKNAKWVRNPIDAFVLARLEKEGLAPAPEADRPALIRRLSLDLTGLPPTLAEVDAFLKDDAPDAYDKLVDRLLASPHYGERWARPWLDLARYADTNGYEKDRPRSLWPWRDWVIQALNDDMPFDEFTIEQLAGDLLPNATTSQKIATGFHRNTLLNDEGGIDSEEFRVVAVKDRVNTTATVWLGTTLECAQCHSHKYDPFTQSEYYQFYAFFNQTADVGVGNGPEMPVAVPAEHEHAEKIKAEIAGLEKTLQEREGKLDAAQADWERKIAAGPAPQPLPQKGLHLHYRLDADKGARADDASGGMRDGLWKGDKQPTWLGYGLQLDGGYLEAPAAADFGSTDAFSYGCWIRPDDLNGGGIIARIDDPHAYRGFDLYLKQGRFEAHFAHQWPDDAMKVATKDAIPAGAWRHVFVVYDGSSKASGATIYVDGKPAALTVEKDALQGSIKTDVPLHVGRRHVMGQLNAALSDVRIYDLALTAAEVGALAARHPALEVLSIQPDRRTEKQRAELAAYFRSLDPEAAQLRSKIAAKQAELAGVHTATTMVMQELPQPRESYVMVRGAFKQKGPKVEPGSPLVLPPMPKDAPRNRLGLARWLVDRDNPLVGRVTVNRLWEGHFGRGFVLTPEDFGSQGERPTHPELLDWLAVEFMDQKWSMKAIHRLIVTSATYRQSSRASADAVKRDPYNLLYGRGPRMRVDGETLRDLSLAAGGLLSPRIGGPSVMPPQPPGVWENSFGFYDLPDFRWKEAQGEDRYRRGIYTFLRRTAIYPTYLMFDGAARDVCMVKRPRTNTPLQALVTLNDPVFVEAAAGLGRRIMTEAPAGAEERLVFAFRVCTARRPTASEIEPLSALYKKALARFEKEPKAAEALVKHCRIEAKDLRIEELAAWTVVGNVLLNLDETMTQE